MNPNNPTIHNVTPPNAPAFPAYFVWVGLAQGLLAWLLTQFTLFSPEWRTNSPLFAAAC